MAFELVSNCRSNEICPVGVEAVLHHQVDVAEVDVAEIDRDLFGVTRLGSQLMHIFCHVYHPLNICIDGTMDGERPPSRGTFATNAHRSQPTGYAAVARLTRRVSGAALWFVRLRRGAGVEIIWRMWTRDWSGNNSGFRDHGSSLTLPKPTC